MTSLSAILDTILGWLLGIDFFSLSNRFVFLTELYNSEVYREKDENNARYLEQVESDPVIGVRVENAMREIGRRYPGKTVLAVTHCGSIRCLFRHLDETDWNVQNLQGSIFYCQNETEKITVGDRILPPRAPDAGNQAKESESGEGAAIPNGQADPVEATS